ncbi:MAG: alpha/beta hydrolase [Anaeromicrobium sp.]|jgi:pimeloyl-[acyl-carrier protein] methyl ester esterase|uniref:alpha/beta fold hydrolase n=1 Tax=Anaeromicrobium sp. TaxID=1929132 RepID=UPI0025FD7A9E|nr:alpha/beta hydrolase [Anaeromicrobium sp.]MCT4593538.1 alpha/beta hydrolase [Anaeromicrobium sp.]
MKKDLLILSGWASNEFLFHDLIHLLSKDYNVTLMEWNHIKNMCLIEKSAMDFFEKKDRVHIIGWSLGSLVALKLLMDTPNKIGKVTLISGFSKFTSSKEYKIGWSKGIVKKMIKEMDMDHEILLKGFYKNMFSPREHDYYNTFLKNIGLSNFNKETLKIGLEYLMDRDFREGLSKINHHVTLIHGTNDLISPITSSIYLNDHIKHSILYELKNVGHGPFYTNPVEVFKIIKEEDDND